MSRLLIKIDLAAVFNRVLDFLGDVPEPIPRDIEIMDVKFKIVIAHLNAILERAIELKEPALLERFEALGMWVPDLNPVDLLVEPHTKDGKAWFRVTHMPSKTVAEGAYSLREELLQQLTTAVYEKTSNNSYIEQGETK